MGRRYRELTLRSVAIGIAMGVILNVAFVYAALQLGFAIGGSTVAAIIGLPLFGKILQHGTTIENNINQTVASCINTTGSGIVFTVPAIFMYDAAQRAKGLPGIDFEVMPLLIGAIGGSLLGVLVIIPLRKQLIQIERLRFPSGTAVITILWSRIAGKDKLRYLLYACAVSALWKGLLLTGLINSTPQAIAESGFGIYDGELTFGLGLLPDYIMPVLYLSLMNVGAGLLSGRGGLPFVVGGMLAWWVISPVAANMGWSDNVGVIYGSMLRPLGIGALIGGALMSVVMTFPAVRSALKSLAAARSGGGQGANEVSLRTIIIVGIVASALLFTAASMTSGVTFLQAILVTVVGIIWLALAALIVAQAAGRTDISPISGMALISVTIAMFMLDHNVTGAMVIGVAVCVGIGQGADMMQDLKTGQGVGATPRAQQLVQLGASWLGALVAFGVLLVLWKNGPGGQGGFGDGTNLPAPQAGALMGIIDSITSNNIPVDKYAIGAGAGALLGAAPISGLGVLVGLAMYLPFSITLGYGLGCFANMLFLRRKGKAFYDRVLVPVGAGLIVGEAVVGVSHAMYNVLAGG